MTTINYDDPPRDTNHMIWRHEEAYKSPCWRDIERHDRQDRKIVVIATCAVCLTATAETPLPSPVGLIRRVLRHWNTSPGKVIWIERFPRVSGKEHHLDDRFLLVQLKTARGTCEINATSVVTAEQVNRLVQGDITSQTTTNYIEVRCEALAAPHCR